jgi:hypothetical protein
MVRMSRPALILILAAAACSDSTPPPGSADPPPPLAAPIDAAAPARVRLPDVATDAQPGDTVAIAQILGDSEGSPSTPATVLDADTHVEFVRATMVRPGPTSSLVAIEGGAEREVVNAALLAFPAHEKTRPGDIVLTVAPLDDELELGRRGLALGYVLTGGRPDAPRVAPLSRTRTNGRPEGWREPRRLAAGSFRRLSGPLAPGTSVLTRLPSEPAPTRPAIPMVLHVLGDQLLVVDRGLALVDARDSEPLPVSPRLAVGDVIRAASRGGVHEMTITVVTSDGAVEATYDQVTRTRTETTTGPRFTEIRSGVRAYLVRSMIVPPAR